MNLSPHFTLAEMTSSAKAKKLGIYNDPPPEVITRLKSTAVMLEKIREALGNVPITVTSAYRCEKLNSAIGSASTSDHVQGWAADFVAPGFGTPYDIAKALAARKDLGIGQLILESSDGKQWVHASKLVPDKAVNRVLTYSSRAYKVGIHPI
jgi:hypothetical protein